MSFPPGGGVWSVLPELALAISATPFLSWDRLTPLALLCSAPEEGGEMRFGMTGVWGPWEPQVGVWHPCSLSRTLHPAVRGCGLLSLSSQGVGTRSPTFLGSLLALSLGHRAP